MAEQNSHIRREGAQFLTLPDEKLVVVTKKHWFVLMVPIVGTIFFALLIMATSFIFSLLLPASPHLFIVTSIITLVLMISLITKMCINWWLHFYVITNRKILEMRYSPLFSHTINEVLLDQVKCTEVDVKTNGIINELLNMGDVMITFDRPTHQEEFVLSDVEDPATIGFFLGDVFDITRTERTQLSWFKSKNKPKNYRFMEDVFEASSFGVN